MAEDKARIYFDNAASSHPKPEEVYLAIERATRDLGANPGRGTHHLAVAAQEAVEDSRKAVAALLGVKEPARIVFTLNATDALNMALHGCLRPMARVVTTSLEHNAVWRPLCALRDEMGIDIHTLPTPSGAAFALDDLAAALRGGCDLLVMTHASNVSGALMPVVEACRLAHEAGAMVLVDAAQTAGTVPIDLEEAGFDLVAFSGHKGLLGPQGVGGLYVRPGLSLKPFRRGGTGGQSAAEDMPAQLPQRLEAGTLNGPGIAGVGAGARFLWRTGVNVVRQHELTLRERLRRGLLEIPGVVVYGPADPVDTVGVLSFNLRNADPLTVGNVLDEVFGVMVRTGLHCAPQAHRSLGTFPRGTVRVGIGFFNTEQEVDYLCESVRSMASDLI